MVPSRVLSECSTSGLHQLTVKTPLCPSPGAAWRSAAVKPAKGFRQLQPQQSRTTTCSISMHPLSTYKFPARQPEVHQWLETCIQDAVKNLDQAPFLQLAYPDRPFHQLERHRIAPAVVSVPQLWRPIAEHLSRAVPEVLVLVHKLSEGASKVNECLLQGERRAENVMTGIAAHRNLTPAGCDQLLQSGMATSMFSGRVGDCCDEAEAGGQPHSHAHKQHGPTVSQVVPFSHSHGRKHHEHGFSGEAQAVDFWGVVVQSKYRSNTEGCYVLKTVRSVESADCQCTHYTLTRVCRGEPLAVQLSSAWL